MKSDENALNEFEKAVLKRMADQAPALASAISELALSSRELTGVGSYTKFASNQTLVFDTSTGPLALDVHISMPGVPLGLGALLFFNANSIAFLEIFAHGDDAWGGNWEGFSLDEREAGIKT
jgi:hypothetical protein